MFCDSENIITPTEVHTNFNIGASGGYLALVNPSGTVITQYQYPEQFPDISYGMDFSGSTPLTRHGQLILPRPRRTPPIPIPIAGVAGTVAASVPAGFYTNAHVGHADDARLGQRSTIRWMAVRRRRPMGLSTPDRSPSPPRQHSVPRPSSPATSRCLRSHGRTSTWPMWCTQSPHDAPGYPTLGAAPAGWPTSWGPNYVDYGMDQTVSQRRRSGQGRGGVDIPSRHRHFDGSGRPVQCQHRDLRQRQRTRKGGRLDRTDQSRRGPRLPDQCWAEHSRRIQPRIRQSQA